MLNVQISDDSYLDKMRTARNGTAVLKIKLANLKSALPRCNVFAFEGIDDKVVYFHWVKRITPKLQYEPFPCYGKDQVLKLKEMLKRDLGNISENVYFFIDRDFDDLRGELADANTFMSDNYSVENYLVSSDILEELLKNEFHCHGDVTVRASILDMFERMYSDFLLHTQEINLRLFLCRRLRIKLKAPLPDKINKIACILPASISPSTFASAEVVQAEREPNADECASLSEEFAGFDGSQRYRGKFALLFFLKWLENLATDRNSSAPIIFPEPLRGYKVRFQNIGLDSLASKSDTPPGLHCFLRSLR